MPQAGTPYRPRTQCNAGAHLERTFPVGEIVRGERAPSREFAVNAMEVRKVRAVTGLSQEKFARTIDAQVGTLREKRVSFICFRQTEHRLPPDLCQGLWTLMHGLVCPHHARTAAGGPSAARKLPTRDERRRVQW